MNGSQDLYTPGVFPEVGAAAHPLGASRPLGGTAVTNDDLLFRHRMRLFARAAEVGVSQACRELGYHRSWYDRWKPVVESQGLEMLRPRERRQRRMPNQLPPWIEEPVISFALGHPGLGPRRVAAQLALPMWGGVMVSASGVLKVLRRHGLGTRIQRLGLVAGDAAKPEREAQVAPEPLHVEVEHPVNPDTKLWTRSTAPLGLQLPARRSEVRCSR